MKCVLITLLLCLTTTLRAQVSYQISSSSLCPCLKTSDVVLRKTSIKSYIRQKAGICHIDAIVFKTVRSLTVCLDPKKPWVKDAMEYLDKKKAAKAIKTTAQPIKPTFNTASTLNTSSHWSGQDELQITSPELHEYITTTGHSFCPCLTTPKNLYKEDIRSYKIHNADVCHLDAVEFETVQGFSFCLNMEEPWAKKAMQFVDNMKKANLTTEHYLHYTETAINITSWDGLDEQEGNKTESTSPKLHTNITFCL